MNKQELIADLKSRVVDILQESSARSLNANIDGKRAIEYSYSVRYAKGLSLSGEETINIVVYNEGEENEAAYYAHGANEQLPGGKNDYQIMIELAYAIDPNVIVFDEIANGVWKIQNSDGSVKLVTLNKDKTGFIGIASK